MDDNISYAGFWKRFLAHLLDKIIIGFFLSIIFIPLWIFGLIGFLMNSETGHYHKFTSAVMQNNWNGEFSPAVLSVFLLFAIVLVLLNILVGWLYFALMESSNKQATLGKIIVGLIVTDLNGNKISFGKASGRYFGKFISGLILGIGYFMAGFTQKKQALHDILASCLVINKFNF